jgi:hypothetical protein
VAIEDKLAFLLGLGNVGIGLEIQHVDGDFDSGCDSTFGAAMPTSGSATPAFSSARRVMCPCLLCAMASLPGVIFDAAFGSRFFKTGRILQHYPRVSERPPRGFLRAGITA